MIAIAQAEEARAKKERNIEGIHDKFKALTEIVKPIRPNMPKKEIMRELNLTWEPSCGGCSYVPPGGQCQ